MRSVCNNIKDKIRDKVHNKVCHTFENNLWREIADRTAKSIGAKVYHGNNDVIITKLDYLS